MHVDSADEREEGRGSSRDRDRNLPRRREAGETWHADRGRNEEPCCGQHVVLVAQGVLERVRRERVVEKRRQSEEEPPRSQQR